MHPVWCAYANHDVTDLVNHGIAKNIKLEYLENVTQLFYNIKKFLTCASYGTF